MNNAECRKAIAEIIYKNRKSMNLNQEQLGVLVFDRRNSGDQQVISKLETCRRDLTAVELIDFARVFKLSPASFLTLIISKSK